MITKADFLGGKPFQSKQYRDIKSKTHFRLANNHKSINEFWREEPPTYYCMVIDIDEEGFDYYACKFDHVHYGRILFEELFLFDLE